jgi:RNA polymerase sigma-70 factor (ECF subfamily)
MDDEIRAHLERQRWAEAFDLLLRQYQTKIFHLAFSILGNQEQAEDAAQEVFIRIWRALPAYRGAASVSTWIYSIARNACLTALKSAGARRTVSLEDPGTRAAAEKRAEPYDRPHAPDLHRLVGELPEKQRQVVTLFYLEEKSYEEVSRLLGMPLGTVKRSTLMPCPAFEDSLRQYDELTAAERHSTDAHLAVCRDCREYLETLADLDRELAALYQGRWPRLREDPAFAAGVISRAAAFMQPRRPSPWPEILDFCGWAAIMAMVALLGVMVAAQAGIALRFPPYAGWYAAVAVAVAALLSLTWKTKSAVVSAR